MKRILLSTIILLSVNLNLFAEFRIKYSGEPLPQKYKDKIEVMLQTMYNFYSAIDSVTESEVELMVFKTQKEGYRYMRSLYPDDQRFIERSGDKITGGSLGGIYIRKYNRAVILGTEQGVDKALELIYHELNHHFIRGIFKKRYAPVWLNEGLSEYFENLEIKGKKAKLGNMPSHDKGRIRTLYMLNDFHLEEYLNLTYNEFSNKYHTNGSVYYSIAHVITAVLLENMSTEKFARLVKLMDNRDTEDNMAQMINDNYKGGLQDLEKDILKFVEK